MKTKIAVVIPAYNESTTIADVISFLPSDINGLPITIIVVNDGSKDGTGIIVAKHKNVVLINHILNSGAGAATRTGLNYAKSQGFNHVVTMDADGQHSAEDVIKMAKHALKCSSDLVIGSRLIYKAGMPWYRTLGNKGLSLLTYLIFGAFVGDSQSGLKVFNPNALEKIQFHSNNYAFCSEIIWKAHKNSVSIEGYPIKAIYSEYSLSKGQSNWNGFNIVRQMLARRILEFING